MDHDFANVLPLSISVSGELRPGRAVDLALPYYREFIVKRGNMIPTSFAGHTLDLYRRLPMDGDRRPNKWPAITICGSRSWLSHGAAP